jgi:hypothetical protein
MHIDSSRSLKTRERRLPCPSSSRSVGSFTSRFWASCAFAGFRGARATGPSCLRKRYGGILHLRHSGALSPRSTGSPSRTVGPHGASFFKAAASALARKTIRIAYHSTLKVRGRRLSRHGTKIHNFSSVKKPGSKVRLVVVRHLATQTVEPPRFLHTWREPCFR